MSVKIHPSAVVDPKAELGDGTEVGPFCVVGPQVRLGKDNVLRSHVVIENRVTAGDRNEFFPFAFAGAAPADLKYKGEPTELIIGSQNKIRESTSLHIGTAGGGGVTRIGDNNLLMAYVHLGHDTHVGNNTVLANGVQIAGHVLIEDWAIIGGLTAVAQFARVGAHAYVGGCSGVERDVPPFALGKGPTGQFQMLGLNLVGLKRRGLGTERISAIMEAAKIFMNRDFEMKTALELMEQQLGRYEEVKRFVDFVRSSESGVYR